MSRRSPKRTFAIVGIAGGLITFILLLYLGLTPPLISWILALSVTTFALYGYDKTQAKLGGGRVPEIVLHALALSGGFLGGWLGMFVFNHKRRKSVFWVVLVISTIIWVLIIWYMYFMR